MNKVYHGLVGKIKANSKSVNEQYIQSISKKFAFACDRFAVNEAYNILAVIEESINLSNFFNTQNEEQLKNFMESMKSVNGFNRFTKEMIERVIKFFNKNKELVVNIMKIAGWWVEPVKVEERAVVYFKKKSVVCVTNNVKYASIKEASLALSIDSSAISKVARGKRIAVKGLVFKYAL